jgi:hypothetical protein
MDVHAIFKRANENVKDVAMAIEYRLAFKKALRLTMEVANLEAFLEKRMSCSYEVMLSS